VVCPGRVKKLTLAVLTAKLKAVTQRPTKQLGEIIRLFQPETVLKWHRERVRRKWHYRRGHSGGRPRTKAELEALAVQFVRENADGGCGKLEGEVALNVTTGIVANLIQNWHQSKPEVRRALGNSVFEYLVYDLNSQRIVDFKLTPWAELLMQLKVTFEADKKGTPASLTSRGVVRRAWRDSNPRHLAP
jgi:hypothetical protein